jgi:fructoselysine 6-kinase
MPRVLGLGDNTIDTYLSAGRQFPGGNAVNVAVFCRRLGAEGSYLGCLGSDEGGAILMDALVAEGVDVSHVRVRQGENARAHIRHENGDRQFVGSGPGVRGDYDLCERDFAFMAAHNLVHTTINSDLDGELPKIAARAQCLSYDFSEKWTPARLTAILPMIDVAFLSVPGRTVAECRMLLTHCRDRGAKLTVITRGADGVVAYADGRFCHRPAEPTTVVDTLGAGDGFIAGFLIAHLSGGAVDEACGAGVQLAASVCTWHGAFGRDRPWPNV